MHKTKKLYEFFFQTTLIKEIISDIIVFLYLQFNSLVLLPFNEDKSESYDKENRKESSLKSDIIFTLKTQTDH